MEAEPRIAVVVDGQGVTPPGLDGGVAVVAGADPDGVLPRADAVFVWDFGSTLMRDGWSPEWPLRWIHTASAGVDALLSDELAASDVVVTNTRGVFARPMAEYVLGLLLAFAKDLRTTLELQARREWRHRETETLAGRRVLLIGAGGVAREIAKLLRPFGVRLDAVGRHPRGGDPDFGTVHTLDELDGLLGAADVVILAVPLNNGTRGLLSRERIARLRPDAWLINVGRGPLVDEPALVDALLEGRIAAAGLDVFAEEPLAADHPLWSLPQVVVSPHMSADRVGWREEVVELFRENLRRWRAGEQLLNVVDKQRDALAS